ncbi:MAG TPA: cytochrome P450 [Actinophytocola sp.]|uniref:cytochrome P450 n=1 Tax=Actinophytocola sp. TaxID=1872138 RepID=UPI002DFFD456|nr:cytochrome P450 [Actinophytocola sp.]
MSRHVRAGKAVPVLGHSLRLLRDPLGFLRRVRCLGDVVEIRLGPKRIQVVNAPDLVHQIMVVEARNFDKGSLFEKSKPFIGNGLANSSGDFHLRQRRLMQPAFHARNFPRYVEIMNEVARTKAASWRPGQILDLPHELHDVTFRTTARTLFSTDLAAPAVDELNRLFPEFLRQLPRHTFAPFPFLEKLPTPANRRFHGAIGRMRGLIHGIIDDYRKAGADHGDLLSLLLLARHPDTGAGMTDEQVHDEAVTLLAGGSETTAAMVGWIFYQLAANPSIEEGVHAELDSVLGGCPVSFGDVDRLPYTRRVLNEALRMYSLALIPRRALVDVDVAGRRHPAGTQFFISPYAMHRDQSLFTDPARFDPDRWLPARTSGADRRTFGPFGAGVHRCIGDTYAMVDMAVIVAAVAARWRLALVPGRQVKERMRGTTRPGALPMIAKSRV